MKTTRTKIFASIAAAFLVTVGAGVLLATNASAAEDEGTNVFQRVAQILGIEEDNLSDAFKQAKIEEIDEKVEAGYLDAEEAEEIKTKIEESEGPMMGMRKGGKGMHREMDDEHKAAVAEFFGISVEELDQAHEDGQRMPDLLEDYGKTQEEMRAFMQEQFPDEKHGPKGIMKGGFGLRNE